MIDVTVAELAAAVGGRLSSTADPETLLSHADTDSRTMVPGSLFIAKPGESTDGHLFIDQALAAGAVLVLAERDTESADGVPHPAVIVDDAVEAMGKLAAEIIRRIRAHSPTTVIGITGSAGKTTTKDLLKHLLEPEGPTVAPQGSYNGEVGVPLTIFGAELQTRFLIVEMGADAPGNIAELCHIVRPDIGVVLMVGSAHAGGFGGSDKIAATKGELAEAIAASGHVILNGEDSQVRRMAQRTTAPITWISSESAPDTVSGLDLRLTTAGHPEFRLCFPPDQAGPDGRGHWVVSGLTGAHHITNLLAAAAAAWRAGIAPADIAERLQGLGPSSRWRMERREIDWHQEPGSLTLINDAYNANPESMREALRTLAMLSRPSEAGSPPRRCVAVLGGMLELGEESIAKHSQMGETVVRLNIDQTLVVGEVAYPLYRGAIAEGSWGSEVEWVRDAHEAETWLHHHLLPGDIVLFKSSRDVGLRLLGDRFAEVKEAGPQ